MSNDKDIRAWARKKNLEVGARGPLPSRVVEAHNVWRIKCDARNSARKQLSRVR